MPTLPSPRECVLRALSASEIAHDIERPDLKASFLDLAGEWLSRAEAAARGGDGLESTPSAAA